MHKVVSSADFQDLEAREVIDFAELMQTSFIEETSDNFLEHL
jgi:hypothetical protein